MLDISGMIHSDVKHQQNILKRQSSKSITVETVTCRFFSWLISCVVKQRLVDVKCTLLVSLVIKIGVLKSRVASRLVTKPLSDAKQNLRHGLHLLTIFDSQRRVSVSRLDPTFLLAGMRVMFRLAAV